MVQSMLYTHMKFSTKCFTNLMLPVYKSKNIFIKLSLYNLGFTSVPNETTFKVKFKMLMYIMNIMETRSNIFITVVNTIRCFNR